MVKINQSRTLAANVEFLEESASTITEAYELPKNMQFDDPYAIKGYIEKTAFQSINFFTFHHAKERMRLAAKHHLVIESAAPYCCKLTTRKLPMNAPNFHKICCFFPSTMGTNHFLQSIQHTEKKRKNKNCPKIYDHKLTSKITTLAFYRLTKSFSICLM